jgi:hypothetical protein
MLIPYCDQTVFLPVVGLVDPKTLKPSDLVGVNKDSYLILDTLPAEYDSRVKAMEVEERPTEDYSDVGGLDKQIQGTCLFLLIIIIIIYNLFIPFPQPHTYYGMGAQSREELHFPFSPNLVPPLFSAQS